VRKKKILSQKRSLEYGPSQIFIGGEVETGRPVKGVPVRGPRGAPTLFWGERPKGTQSQGARGRKTLSGLEMVPMRMKGMYFLGSRGVDKGGSSARENWVFASWGKIGIPIGEEEGGGTERSSVDVEGKGRWVK